VGDVLKVVADLGAAGRLPPQKMKIVDDEKSGLTGDHAIQRALGQLRGGTVAAARMGEEPEHRAVEILHTGIAGQPDTTHRPAFISATGDFAMLGDFAAVKVFGEIGDGDRFTESGKAVDCDG